MTEPRTPLPWTPATIVRLAFVEDVEFAVRACNSHDEMVAALEMYMRRDHDNRVGREVSEEDWATCHCLAFDALAKAKKAP